MKKLLATQTGKALAVIFGYSLFSIVTAWGFELIGGFIPCELCLTQRIAYYIVVPLAAIMMAMVMAGKLRGNMLGWGVLLLGLVMLAGGTLGAYHAGIEWGFWQGPSSCTGAGSMSSGLPDLTKKIVMCDEVQIRIMGLSFAGWNALVSWFCALVALWGFVKRNRD